MNANEFSTFDAVALSHFIESKKVSPHELMQSSISLAQKVNEKLHFLCHEKFDESLELSKQWVHRGAFRGVPFLLKDSGVASKRFPSSLGSQLFKDSRFGFDSTLVQRFDRAGFIPFARTTVPEFCMATTSEATVYAEPTRNPWDPSRSPGGSSGGAAAAVAAGVVPVAHGSDGGGSIRIPAACCGVYGYKPSRGLVPMGPTRGEGWGGLAVDGVLSRTVRDTAVAMDEIAGYEAGAPYAAPQFPEKFAQAIQTKQGQKLRIGVWRDGFKGVDIAPEALQALEKTVQLCKDLGHDVIDMATPDFNYASYTQAHADILSASIVYSVETKLGLLGRALQISDLERSIYTGYEHGKTLPAASYVAAINTLHQVGRWMAGCMADIDILMTPALNRLPEKLGVFTMDVEYFELRKKIAQYTCFIAMVNASGQPAATLPTYWTAEGLPMSTQIIGHFGQDDLVLALSAQIEATGQWHPAHHRYVI